MRDLNMDSRRQFINKTIVHEWRIPSARVLNQLYQDAKYRGEITKPRDQITAFRTKEPNTVLFNTTRIENKSSLNGWCLTDAEITTRKQIMEIVRFRKKNVLGYENSNLSKIGTQIVIGESRRFPGEYILTEDDVLSGKHFNNGITCSAYQIILRDEKKSQPVIINNHSVIRMLKTNLEHNRDKWIDIWGRRIPFSNKMDADSIRQVSKIGSTYFQIPTQLIKKAQSKMAVLRFKP